MSKAPKDQPKTEFMQTALRIPKDKHKRLKMISVQQDKSLHELYLEAIDYLLSKYSPKAK